MTVEVKTVLLGDSAVGKTCLLGRIVNDLFIEDVTSTVGGSHTYKSLMYGDKEVKLHLWDTAGQERYRCLAPMYYRQTQAVILVYAVNDRRSFEVVDFWVDSLMKNGISNALMFLVGNKIDLDRDENGVLTDEGIEKAQKIGAEFAEVSAKTGVGVLDFSNLIAEKVVNTLLNRKKKTAKEETHTPVAKENEHKNDCC